MSWSKLSNGEQLKAMRLHREGLGWRVIGVKLQQNPETVRRACDAHWREMRAQQASESRARRRGKQAIERMSTYGNSAGNPNKSEMREAVPAYVLAERERRMMLEPASTTAALCGDPLPGRSALDKRRGHG